MHLGLLSVSDDAVAATLAALNVRLKELIQAIHELAMSIPTGKGEDDAPEESA